MSFYNEHGQEVCMALVEIFPNARGMRPCGHVLPCPTHTEKLPSHIRLPCITHSGSKYALEVSAADSDGDVEFEVCTDDYGKNQSVWLNADGRRQLREWLEKFR